MQLYRSRVKQNTNSREYYITEGGSIKGQTASIAEIGMAATYNNPISIGSRVNSTAFLFDGCTSYNCPIDIPVNVNKTAYMFNGCTNFNSTVNILCNSYTVNADNMFADCVNLNKNIQIVSKFGMSANCMFRNCTKFNQELKFEQDWTMQMFENCISLNKNININTQYITWNAYRMYYGCTNLNIRIPVECFLNTPYMFQHCYNLNQSFVWSGYPPSNSAYMFEGCNNLNKTIGWTKDAGDPFNCVGMLANCTKFNQDITVPRGCNNLYQFLYNCKDFSKTVYIKGTRSRELNISGLFYECNNSKRKNIRFNSALDSIFRATAYGKTLIWYSITWTSLTNGFYNSVYNIYCYNDYSG